MLFGSGAAIFGLQITSLGLKFKYPPKDCLSKDSGFFYTEYKSSNDKDRLNKIRKDARKEYGDALTHR